MRLFPPRRQAVLCWVLQTLLLLSVATAQLESPQTCESDSDCQAGFSCSNTLCIPKDCVKRELEALGIAFDPREYRDMIFQEAGVTIDDLQLARKNAASDAAFAQDPQVSALMDTVLSHGYELGMIGEIVRECEADPALDAPGKLKCLTKPVRRLLQY